MAIKASMFRVEQWSQGLWPVTALLGDEAFFITRIGDAWRQYGRDDGYVERVVIDQSNASASNCLMAELGALSLFAEQVLVELKLSRTVLENGLKEAILEWIKREPNNKRLLISGGKLGKSEVSSDWYKQLDKQKNVIDASTIPSYEFSKWLDHEIANSSIKVGAEGRQAIIAHTHGNMLAADQTLKRLKVIQPSLLDDSNVNLEVIINALTQSSRHTVYDLVDLALKGDIPTLNRVSDLIISEGIDAISLLWIVHREISLLLQIRWRVDNGETINQALKALRVWHSRESLIRKGIERLNLNQLRKLQALCHEADQTIKGQRTEPPWLILKDILFGLAGFGYRC